MIDPTRVNTPLENSQRIYYTEVEIITSILHTSSEWVVDRIAKHWLLGMVQDLFIVMPREMSSRRKGIDSKRIKLNDKGKEVVEANLHHARVVRQLIQVCIEEVQDEFLIFCPSVKRYALNEIIDELS